MTTILFTCNRCKAKNSEGLRNGVCAACEAKTDILAPREYTFDIVLAAAVTVTAKTGAQALAMVREHFECADCNGGAWPSGDPVLFEASLKERPCLGLIDGEDYSAITLNDWDRLAAEEAKEADDLRLYNCLPGNNEPDWTLFDSLEIHGCIRDEDGTEHNLDGDDEGAQYYCIFGHLKTGGLVDIANTKTPDLREAMGLFRDLSAISGLK